MTMTNFETKLAWRCHAEHFEYYAVEGGKHWILIAKEFFTEEHGAEECAKIDWEWIAEKVKPAIEYWSARQ